MLAARSVNPHLRRDRLNLIGKRGEVDWPVVDQDAAVLLQPGKGVFEPVRVVAGRVVLTRVRAPAFGSSQCGMQADARLRHQVIELERFAEIAVPDERMVCHAEVVAQADAEALDTLDPFIQQRAITKDSAVALHHALHFHAQFTAPTRSLGPADPVKPAEGTILTPGGEWWVTFAGCQDLRGSLSGGTTENNEVNSEFEPSLLAP